MVAVVLRLLRFELPSWDLFLVSSGGGIEACVAEVFKRALRGNLLDKFGSWHWWGGEERDEIGHTSNHPGDYQRNACQSPC